ncbi:MAG: nickel/cobalt transporter [Alphaproteobacteria bacterium]|nr:nickel/cobalt transporter [Alphaproteobacteria bacterium]
MRGLRAGLFAALLALGLAAPMGQAWAQQAAPGDDKPTDSRRLMVPPKNADGSIRLPPFWQDPVLWMRDEQQNFYGAMSGAMRAIGQGNSMAPALSLMGLSFGYGVFHAAGPGHGKAVISAWLLATRSQLRRGILVAFFSAVVQALTAIVLVTLLLLLVASAAPMAKDMAAFLESASYAMIAGLGAYMLWPLLRQARALPAVPQTAGHQFEIVNPLPAGPGHVHGPDCGCDHAHLPGPADVAQDWSWGRAFSLAFAVGIRPCTGALLVLIFANATGIYGAGIAATFMMALGTFITVSVVAATAVYARKIAERLAGRDTRWMQHLGFAMRLGGGLAILLFGVLLFWASLSGPSGNM